MKLLNKISFLLFPLVGSIFRLPKWLYNPLTIVTHLPSAFLPSESQHQSRDLHSCVSVITTESPIFSSPQSFHSRRCQAKIEINPKICNLRVKLTEFNLKPGHQEKCGEDRFYISTNIDDERNRDRGGDTSGYICGARPGTEIHIPVSQVSTVYLNVNLSATGKSTARWSMKVEQERCEDNLVRKFGLLDSVERCRNRRKSRQNAKETFRRMKKQLFSRRRSHRNRRSVFDWLFKLNERKDSSEDNDSGDKMEEVGVTRKNAGSQQNTFHKVTGVKNTNGVPADFFVVASSSNMELSKYSSQNSGGSAAPVKISQRRTGDKLKVKRNYKRRKSLFKTTKSKKSSCPVFLYTLSEGLTCMCR